MQAIITTITKANAKEWLPLLQAMADGKQIQHRTLNGQWIAVTALPTFDSQPSDYRIAPEPRRVPLAMEDIPPVCWVRIGLGATEYLVRSIHQRWIGVNGELWSFDQAMTKGLEYSSDRKTWKPCWKEAQE